MNLTYEKIFKKDIRNLFLFFFKKKKKQYVFAKRILLALDSTQYVLNSPTLLIQYTLFSTLIQT